MTDEMLAISAFVFVIYGKGCTVKTRKLLLYVSIQLHTKDACAQEDCGVVFIIAVRD